MDQLATIDAKTRIAWHGFLPFDCSGRPTSEVVFRAVYLLFEHRNRAFRPKEMAEYLCIHDELAEILFAQLLAYAIVVQEPPLSGRFRYYLDSPNIDFQAKVESNLVDFWNWSTKAKLPPFPPLS